MGAARNLGVSVTAAPYVTFLDADDCLSPGYFTAAAEAFDADPTLAFVTCGMVDHERGGQVWQPSIGLVDGLVRAHVHVSSVVRRESFNSVGGFDTRLAGLEDAALFTSLVACGGRGVVLDTPYPGTACDAAHEHRPPLNQPPIRPPRPLSSLAIMPRSLDSGAACS